MGVYVSVRGWLECDREQLAFVKSIIGAYDDGHYIGGWGFPTQAIQLDSLRLLRR
jgi:hypothetical protein